MNKYILGSLAKKRVKLNLKELTTKKLFFDSTIGKSTNLIWSRYRSKSIFSGLIKEVSRNKKRRNDIINEKNFAINKIWIKNFLIIIFYIGKFKHKMKKKLLNSNFKKLNSYHFDIINDLSGISENFSNFNALDKIQKKISFIIENYQSNVIKRKIKLLILCNLFLNKYKNYLFFIKSK